MVCVCKTHTHPPATKFVLKNETLSGFLVPVGCGRDQNVSVHPQLSAGWR